MGGKKREENQSKYSVHVSNTNQKGSLLFFSFLLSPSLHSDFLYSLNCFRASSFFASWLSYTCHASGFPLLLSVPVLFSRLDLNSFSSTSSIIEDMITLTPLYSNKINETILFLESQTFGLYHVSWRWAWVDRQIEWSTTPGRKRSPSNRSSSRSVTDKSREMDAEPVPKEERYSSSS